MRVIDPGHVYELQVFPASGMIERGDRPRHERLVFIQRPVRAAPNQPLVDGTNCQEVIRVLIDRVEFLHDQEPHRVNSEIIQHLRMALTLFETRAIERRVEKGHSAPERLGFSDHNGHWRLEL